MNLHWKKWRLRILSLGMGGGLALLLAEASLRVLGIGYPQLYQPDPHCGSRLRPNTGGVWISEGFGHISINSLGFRGPEIEIPKPHNRVRIAVLGDSFIEALQVDYDASFCQQLEERLEGEQFGEADRVEVINCGVSGYGTAQQLLMLQHYVWPLQPDVVLLAFYPENDVRNNHPLLEEDPRIPYYALVSQGQMVLDDTFRASDAYRLASSWYEQWKAAWVNRSRVLQLVRHVRLRQATETQLEPATDSPSSLAEQLCQAVQDANYIYSQPVKPAEREAWDVTERLIQQVAASCHQRQVRCVVFTVSTSLQVYPDPQLRRQIGQQCGVEDLFYAEQRMRAMCEQQQIEFVPLASSLQLLADANAEEYLHGFRNTQMGIGHWSAAGHRAAATVLAEYLKLTGG